MMRLRRGKSRPRGSQPIGISDTTAPPCLEDRVDQGGVVWPDRSGRARRPAPRRCRSRSAALWARASMPRASPETTTKPASPRPRGQALGEGEPGGRGVARADDGDRRAGSGSRRRRARAMSGGAVSIAWSSVGIVGLAHGDEADAEARGRRDLAPRPRAGVGGIDARPPARRARSGRASRAAPAPPKRLIRVRKRARADALGADQPQPVEALGVGELHGAPSSDSARHGSALLPDPPLGAGERAGGCWARASTIAAAPSSRNSSAAAGCRRAPTGRSASRRRRPAPRATST